MKWTTNKQQHEYMRMRTKQNKNNSKLSKAETWMNDKLKQTPHKWSRQAQWGYRIFDFWCHTLGLAIEIDGKEHNKNYDSYRDKQNLMKSGIVVLHVRNFNEDDAIKALEYVANAENWNDRRLQMQLNPIKSVPIKSENTLFTVEGKGSRNPAVARLS